MPYLIFDIETVTNRSRMIRCDGLKPRPGETEDAMVDRVSQEYCDRAKKDSDPADKPCFVPARFQDPAVIVMLLVDDNLRYLNHRIIAHRKGQEPDPKTNTKEFWDLYNAAGATLVGFNSIGFDTPVMETCGLEYGADLSRWWLFDAKAWEDGRGAIAHRVHFDLYKFLAAKTNLQGGLSFWSRLIGLPGKLDTSGAMVADMLKRAGGHDETIDYCVCDVLNTYGLLYNVRHGMGLAPGTWRSEAFTEVVARMAVGRGKEVQSYQNFIDSELKAGGLF